MTLSLTSLLLFPYPVCIHLLNTNTQVEIIRFFLNNLVFFANVLFMFITFLFYFEFIFYCRRRGKNYTWARNEQL